MRLLHVSLRDLGARVTFVPRVPLSGMNECKLRDRICVATSLRGCLLAIQGVSDLTFYTFAYWRKPGRPPPVVYQFRGPSIKPTPEEVPDVIVTGERWLLSERVGERIGYVDMNELVNNQRACLEIDVERATYRKPKP